MNEKPGEEREEEPQAARGPKGSRDTGSDEPGGGPVDRPTGKSDEKSDTSVDSQGTIEPDMPELQTGDQGG